MAQSAGNVRFLMRKSERLRRASLKSLPLATRLFKPAAQNWAQKAKAPVLLPASLSRGRGKSSALTAGLTAGVALTLTALWVHRAARQAEKRHPASGNFVEVDGVCLHYLECGAGQPVVVLHGNGVYARDVIGSGLAKALAQRYRVLAFDRPGFGYSQRPRSRIWTPEAQARLLRGALVKLGVERPLIVAHSWATLVALALALQYPDLARGLLLISGYYYPTLRLDSLLLSAPAIPLVGDLLRYTLSPLLGRWLAPLQLRQLFAPEPVPARFREAVPLEMVLRPGQLRASAAEAALMVPAAKALAPHFGDLHLPVTLVAGAEDRLVDYRSHSARLHRELPHSRMRVLPGRGHMLHYAEAERLALDADELFAASTTQEPSPLPSAEDFAER